MTYLEKLSEHSLLELEGVLFAHLYMFNSFGNLYTMYRDLYTIKEGKVYIIEGKKLTKVNMNYFQVTTQFRRIGIYDLSKPYKSTSSKEYSYSDVKKIFKL